MKNILYKHFRPEGLKLPPPPSNLLYVYHPVKQPYKKVSATKFSAKKEDKK